MGNHATTIQNHVNSEIDITVNYGSGSSHYSENYIIPKDRSVNLDFGFTYGMNSFYIKVNDKAYICENPYSNDAVCPIMSVEPASEGHTNLYYKCGDGSEYIINGRGGVGCD